MVAARREFLPADCSDLLPPEFVGSWQLDRVSGLLDERLDSVHLLTIAPDSLAVTLRASSEPMSITVAFDGPTAEGHDAEGKYAVQALLEGNALVWELERPSGSGLERVRRVMRPSDHGAQLIAERVDLSDEGSPRGLGTEYWIRSASHS